MTAPGRVAYEPPQQSMRGQLLDAMTILALIFATLFVTTYLTTADGTDDATTSPPALSALPLTEGERTQYQKMIDTGTADQATIASAVATNRPDENKYEIDVLALLGTAALLAVYLGFVYRTSLREYREVVEEKFGPRTTPPSEEDR